jgi:Animal haem peroxidase
MKRFCMLTLIVAISFLQGCDSDEDSGRSTIDACVDALVSGPRKIATDRADRFQGKVAEARAFCRGGSKAVEGMRLPWLDWGNYYGASDKPSGLKGKIGVNGALLDLEYQRLELIKFNLFENSGSFRDYILGRGDRPGPTIKTWNEMRMPKDHPDYKYIQEVEGPDPHQLCTGELIRKRTLTGICNDIRNPMMGSTGQLFARNAEFETTFPELGVDEYARNRHGDRLGLLQPDPQVISRRLFTRQGHNAPSCRDGMGAEDRAASKCDYDAAPFFNVMAAFWIQFMTHDWFSHMQEGHNDKEFMKVGCSPEDAARYGCRPEDRIDRAYVAESTPPATFKDAAGKQYLTRAPKTMQNFNTAWWDASQIYGYDETSLKRVKRDPADRALLLLEDTGKGPLLPLFQPDDPINPEWTGQEATAFPDNWTVGISFLTNLFVREHNSFVKDFRAQALRKPNADCGLRNPANPKKVIRYRDVTPDELFDVARLVVSAEIAKIHTIEWTPQLLYDEPLFKAMNANWNGLIGPNHPGLTRILQRVVQQLGDSKDPRFAAQWYSAFASGAGIVGTGSKGHHWSIDNEDSVNGGVNHFGSPFNFPEEFITVYRLHPLVPDLLEYREIAKDPNQIVEQVPVVETFRRKATDKIRSGGLSNWALTMGRQRLGLLKLNNHPAFLQNLRMNRLDSNTKQIDVAALDLIRDREHGVPRFNEFRRQYGLRTLTSFDDFLDRDPKLPEAQRNEQAETVAAMREIYGQHVCDASKIITHSQRGPDGEYINDCLGHPNGSTVDNVEDLDTVVGFLAEPIRPHGFAISETQFVVFILNASRRLFSDRFLTSSFRPEFYTRMGLDWVNNNGPGKPKYEPGKSNGHGKQPVSPMKRVLLRNVPGLEKELEGVRNAFDPWARRRGPYYSLEWAPRPGAESDPSFERANK